MLPHQWDSINRKYVTRQADLYAHWSLTPPMASNQTGSRTRNSFRMARRNYCFAAYIGLKRYATARINAVLDTGAVPSFIKRSIFPCKLQKHILQPESQDSEKDGSNRQVSVKRIINLSVNVGSQSTIVAFNVAKLQTTESTLGCDFCDTHLEAI